MATLEELIRGFGTIRSSETEVVDPGDDEHSPWRHELRMPGPGETFESVWAEAMEYRERTGTSAMEWILARGG